MKMNQLLPALLLISSLSVHGQKNPAVFGKIDIEDLKMTTYEPDSTAPALVLCDFGWFNSSKLQFTRLLRIKILKKEGYAYGNSKYLTRARPTLRAITYNLDGNEIIKDKLKGTEVYTKQISSNLYETSFAMPNVAEGSVLDIEFIYAGLPSEWDFQWLIPVRHSELIIQHSDFVEFTRNFFGYVPLKISEPTRWVAKDVPAYKPEPFIDSHENYITKFEIMLKRIYFPGYNQEINTTWENINSLLLQESSFPSVSDISLCLSPLVTELKKSGKVGEELIRAAFEKAREVKYNEENSLFISEEGICARYKMRSGNSADINSILIQILNRLDIVSYPVVLSTRDNGIVSEFCPSVDKLNYLMAAIKTDNGYRFIDATEEYLPCTLLPERCINGNAMVVIQSNPVWLPIICNGKEKRSVTYNLSLDDDLSLKGEIIIDAYEYAAYDFRKKYAKFNDTEEYLRSLEKEHPGLTITEATINNVEDLYGSVNAIYSVKIDGAVTRIDDEVFINPMIFESLNENPFKDNQRVYPVSYSRKIDNQVVFNLALDERHILGIKPLAADGKTKNNSLSFKYETKDKGDHVQIVYNFNINDLTILQKQYPELREVYNQIVRKHQEPLIIKII
jgi:hypothetical protein